MITLRPYQNKLKSDVFAAWDDGAQIVCMVSGTGTGKTRVIESISGGINEPTVVMAHRQELVSQLSCALASADIAHDLICAKNTRDAIVKKHFRLFGRTTYQANAIRKVASVDTLNASTHHGKWEDSVTTMIQDEGHHTLKLNKWGRAFSRFRNLKRGILATATPNRADKRGLGSWVDGIADAMVEGPPMRWVIDNGYLTDYKIVVHNTGDLDLSNVSITESGDFSPTKLAEAVKKSKQIVGDIVGEYLKYCKGKRGVTFAVDVDHARTITEAFNRAGVPAQMVHAKTPDAERDLAIQKLEAGELLQLVNVDLFGEGVDLPTIECVSFGRPTMSLPLYHQQFGRVLRLLLTAFQHSIWDSLSVAMRLEQIAKSPKPIGWVFDHVGNIYRHKGPPDAPQVWSLEGGRKRAFKPGDDIPLRKCLKCYKDYLAIETACPFCGTTAPAPSGRSTPREVEGDMYLMTPEALALFRGDAKSVMGPAKRLPGRPELAGVLVRQHDARRQAQVRLRALIDLWAGTYPDEDRVRHKRFYYLFGVDILSAASLGASDADNLHAKIVTHLTKRNIKVTI